MASAARLFARKFSQTPKLKSAVNVEGPSAVSGREHDGGYKVWKNLSLFAAFPCIALAMVYCYLEHTKHEPARPEFVKYEHMRIRTKRFPWGEGQKSLFHNAHTNPLPDGYEEGDH